MSTVSRTVSGRDHYRMASPDAGPVRRPGAIGPAAYFRWKGPLDRCLAAVLLVPALPVIALLVLLVRLTSRGPGIYKQRAGRQGWASFHDV